MKDVILIGAGHNGLAAAFYLARAGLKPLVLERRPIVGGVAVTEEIHPGFRCPTVAHAAGPLHATVARDMALERHGLRTLRPDVHVFAPAADGRALILPADAARAADAIRAFSAKDAGALAEFHRSVNALATLIAELLPVTPPSIDAPSAGDLWNLLRTGRRFRALARRDQFRLLRWIPMPAADFVSEWFETDVVRAVHAAPGILGLAAGPWSAGTTAALLMRRASHDGDGFAVEGGPGALTAAMAAAARAAGADIRTHAEVDRVTIAGGRATGVVLTSGEVIDARAVVANADPRRALLTFVGPDHLDPGYMHKLRNYRSAGVTAKVNLALGELPRFSALANASVVAEQALAGRIHVGPGIDYLERAFDASKYGTFSTEPFLDIRIPSVLDATLAPQGRHVMSIHAQYAPYTLREGDWSGRRDELGDIVVRALARHAPGIESAIVARRVITPADLESVYGLTGGHIFHGELALDQLYTMRPLLGWARYRTPIHGYYLCGSGTHPGVGLTGASGLNASREILADLKTTR